MTTLPLRKQRGKFCKDTKISEFFILLKEPPSILRLMISLLLFKDGSRLTALNEVEYYGEGGVVATY